MTKYLYKLFLVLPFFVFLFLFVFQAKAGTVTSISVSLSNSAVSSSSTYTVAFTPQNNVPASGMILLRFIHPMGLSFGLNEATLNASTSAQITGIDTSQAGNNVLVFSTSGLTGGNAYTIKINNITNPSSAGMGMIAVATQNAGSNIDGNLQVDPPQVLSPSFQIGTAAFTGRVTNPSGDPVSNAWVNIFSANPSGAQPQGSSTNYNGDYMITTTNISSATDYILEVFAPFSGGGNMVSPDRATETYSGSPITRNFQFTVATKTITGTLTYSDNNAVIANAQVNAFKMNGSGFAQATTNESGVYTLSVGGGDWGVMPQATQSAGWSYGQPPESVKFNSDTSNESKTVNFSVYRASATITGRILKPGGTPASQADGVGGVGVFSMEGKGGSGQVESNGTFSISVPSGTYKFNVWVAPNSEYGSPSVDPITVADNEAKNVGDLTLSTRDVTINGTVKDSNGTGIANVNVNAFVRDGGGFAMAQTNGSGNFQLKLTAGKWMIMPYFDYSGSYALNEPPQEITVVAGQTVNNVIFTAQTASATINGVVQDASGSPVSVYGYAFAESPSGEMFGPGGLGGPIQRGSFSFKVPAGTYSINAGLAPGTGYTPGNATSITVTDGQTANVTVTVKTNDATITGSILDDSGNLLSGSSLFVFAVSNSGGSHAFQQGTVSGSTYTINVSAGEWTLGYFVDPSAGYMSAPPDPSMKFTVTSGGTTTRNISLKTANSTISGTVKKPDGSAAVGAFVSIDNRETEGKEFFNGSVTDTNGSYTIKTTGGTYKIRANVAPNSGFLSPAEQNVTVSANETQTVNFTLRESDGTISGTVTLNGNGVTAFVYAFSDDGGFTQTTSNSSGAYSLAVSSGTIWHVGARYESSTTPYESSETTVSLTGTTGTADLTLSQVSYSLPQALTTTFDSTQPKLITLTDGTEINIPASSLATSGDVTLTINPKASLPSKKGDKPVWYGYEFSATDSSGQSITSFNSSITITFPYTEAQLTRLGITADDLVPSYWDETSGSWKKVSNVTVDTTTKTVTITVDHFTDFALTANIATATTSTTSTTTTTSSSSNSSSSSSSSGSSAKPLDFLAKQGGVIKRNNIIAIVEANTFPWDSYLSSIIYPKKGANRINNLWQVSDIYDLWFKASFNDAKIVSLKKPSIIAISYNKFQLDKLPENSLKLAFSADEGKTWKVLPTSIVDTKAKFVAALSEIKGYYAIVGGYGSGIAYASEKSVTTDVSANTQTNTENKNDSQKQDSGTLPPPPQTPNPVDNTTTSNTPPSVSPVSKKSFFQSILDFIFRR